MAAAGWKTDGLPAHMVASLPHTAEVKVRDRTGVHWISHHVQLERDGVPLKKSDVRGWFAGEAEGWRPTPIKAQPPSEEIIDIEAEEIHE